MNVTGSEPSAGGDAEVDDFVVRVSKVRHEVNNHLTAALAEIQLLLMDTEGDEERESYEIVQDALRGIRSAIASIGHLRR